MTLWNRVLFLGLFLVLPAVSAQAASPVASIHMPGLDIPLTRETIAVNLKPGESLDDQAVVLVPGLGVEPGSFKVQTQFETSATVKGGGPQAKPLYWKRSRSEWTDLEQVGDLEYRLPAYTKEDAVRFSSVSPLEIYLAALESGGSHWTETVLVKGPNGYPAGVGISAVRLRVLVQDGNEWRELHQVELRLPAAGC